MIIGFTGTQDGMSKKQLSLFSVLISVLPMDEFHHGDCIGADSDAHTEVRKQFPKQHIVIHPPRISAKRANRNDENCSFYVEKDYMERNKDIVNQCNILIAAPKGSEELRSGTWATVRYARKQNVPIIILDP